ncbi:hybrid sensor histidine kinase/response regulator transcription factor [Paenibacillus mucilaginosus]|uniref:helix-turn-helix transcriptional regulator n=1 Tax=Paenibacillus mucilaginosus TaxID=61624 RepID=UPI0005A06000|nr:hybrid sensor histidine kinase/response regulator transcription factor [Paenibacillus mucilaginosus]MCG7212920.1 hybrid sensor histidine kinase/response regulator transcription factor [Paenibacillus mucilaginosus]WDM26665.1 hybrid sensor histidine kinase/response regulator transcription factor [Paenibacillus mucilaginosus]
MLSIIKKWFWYDWIAFAIRTFWLVTILSAEFIDPSLIVVPFWRVVILASLVYLLPLLIQYRKESWYLGAEVIAAGFFHVYLAYAAPGLLWTFILLVMIVGLGSTRRTYVWTGLPLGIIFPAINGWIADRSPYEFIFSCSFGFAIGFAFNVLIQSSKQARIIQEQKQLLEQHLTRIEELTLMEERNRLSHELHDTIGHTLTSMIIGVESLRSSVPDSEIERIDSLVRVAQRSLDDIRKHLHQLSPVSLGPSLGESLRQLSDEFMKSTGVAVSFRVIGSEPPLMQKINFCLYRCLQESLTNAVRHGQASAVSVQLHVDNQQLRLQIEDNGIGAEGIRFGFGLSGIKERMDQLLGTLTVHSQLGQGTVIICSIPLQTEPVLEMIRLLIVDDQEIVTGSLKQNFDQDPNFIVVGTAGDGHAALECCEQSKPDIVLMDIRMQGMNGLEALMEMKHRWPAMKVVLMTTFEDSISAATALEHGAEGYMLKSIHPREMMEALKLIYNGGTWIDQSIATRLFEGMKRQREQLKKYGSSQEQYPYGLTKREMEILKHLSNGLRYKSIAAKMCLSEGTIRNYCSILYSKLGVSNREEAVGFAQTESIL